MSYNSIIIFYLVISFLALISVIFSVYNWFNLSSISSTIIKLQREINKKGKEFLSLKKENNELHSKKATYSQSERNEKIYNAYQSHPTSSSDNQPQITIVRNIRQKYDDTALAESTDQPDQSNTQDLNNIYYEKSSIKTEINENTQNTDCVDKDNASSESSMEVLDVVENTETQSSSLPARYKTITLNLYSTITKDADFQKLGQDITEAMRTSDHLHINIDFKNIMYLYSEEIDYLRKIYDAVKQRQGTLVFINCCSELESILNQDSILSYLTK